MEKSSFIRQEMYQDVPMPRRTKKLEEHCYKIEDSDVHIPFTDKEIAIKDRENSEALIKLEKLNEEKEKWMTEWKAKQKPLAALSTKIIKELRDGYRVVEKEVYLFPDRAHETMGRYDEYGELVSSRELREDEDQLTLNNNKSKTA